MTDPPFTRVKQIFCEAIDRPGAERDQFVQQACGDDLPLLRAVQQLLNEDDKEVSVPGWRELAGTLQANNETWIGRRIGPYELVERIGRGGMGDVYRARRTTGFDSEVAIKISRGAAWAADFSRRFREEIKFQAALGKHPNIAAILDAGETDEGAPYFVMDLVDGMRIDAYCDKHQLSTRQRLQLFRRVCDAVQFAHQNTVIHRDLKPSNILVRQDGQPVLIDFGIAKWASPQSTSSDTLTVGQAFTPDYASPEQVRAEPMTTATDVYSLGMILYELLSGHRAYHVDSRVPHALAEQILSSTPLRPSEIIANLPTVSSRDNAAEIPTTAQICTARAAPLSKLRRLLRGDLDTIVLTALRKEPARRYATVGQFSDDIRRYLEGLPIIASPDRYWYRAGKFLRRHKLMVTAAAAVLVAIVAGLIGTALGLAEARRQRDVAAQNFDYALDAVDQMLLRVGDEMLADVPHMAQVRRELLEDALAFYQRFLDQGRNTPQLPAEIAQACRAMGSIYEKLNQLDDARSAYESARNALQSMSQENGGTAYDRDMARLLSTVTHNLGNVALEQGRVDDAKTEFAASQQQLLELRTRFPAWQALAEDQALGLTSFGLAWEAADPARAEIYYRQAIELLTPLTIDQPANAVYRDSLAVAWNNLGVLLAEFPDRLVEAQSAHEAAIDLRQALLDEFPERIRNRQERTISYNNLAYVYGRQGNAQQAVETLRQAVQLQQALVADYPDYPQHTRELARLHSNLAPFLAEQDQLAAAVTECHTAAELLRALIEKFPGIPGLREELAVAIRSLANLHREMGEDELAATSFDEELELNRVLVQEYPEIGSYRRDLSTSLIELGSRLERSGDERGALRAYAESIELGGQHPDAFFNRARAHVRAGRWQEAIDDFSAALRRDPLRPDCLERRAAAYRTLDQPEMAVADYSAAIALRPDQASLYRRRGSCYRDLEQYDQAIADYQQAIELRPDYASAHNSLGVAFDKQDRIDEAIAAYSRAIALAPGDPVCLDNRANMYAVQAKWPLAEQDWTAAIEIEPNNSGFYLSRSRARGSMYDWEGVLEDTSKAVKLDAEEATAWQRRGEALAELGRWDEAVDDFDQAAELDRSDRDLRVEQALAAVADGDRDRYRELCQRLLADFPIDESLRAEQLRVLLTVLLDGRNQVDWQLVAERARQLYALAPATDGSKLILGLAQSRVGSGEAKDLLSEAGCEWRAKPDQALPLIARCYELQVRHKMDGTAPPDEELSFLRERAAPRPSDAESSIDWKHRLILREFLQYFDSSSP